MSNHRREQSEGAAAPQRFTKGHGTRNDFVLIPDPEGRLALDADAVAAISDRRGGIGADGVIRIVRTAVSGVEVPGTEGAESPGAEGADAEGAAQPEWLMDYRNADGSIAEMCGNGVRVFAACLDRAGLAGSGDFVIATRAGARRVEILERPAAAGDAWQVRVGMGPGRLTEPERTVTIAGRTLPAWDVDMGNPHAVALLPDDLELEDLDLTVQPALDPMPEGGANIELVARRGERHVAMRVFERGVGETQSCGTGAAAVGLAAAHWAGDDSGQEWRVDVPGGSLVIGFRESEMTLAGPAVIVADGSLAL